MTIRDDMDASYASRTRGDGRSRDGHAVIWRLGMSAMRAFGATMGTRPGETLPASYLAIPIETTPDIDGFELAEIES